MRCQAFIIESEAEKGIEMAQAWAMREFKMQMKGNPDIVVLRYGLFSVSDARSVADTAMQAPFSGEHKIIIITASRAYHEAQNALLKLFEEPPLGVCLFLILPTLGGLLPTLRSRVDMLDPKIEPNKLVVPEAAKQFMRASREKRSVMAKKLASGKDEEERREHRDQAIEIVQGIEAVAYESLHRADSSRTANEGLAALLADISVLRGHLYDRSAPVRMILEHLSLVIPKDLV